MFPNRNKDHDKALKLIDTIMSQANFLCKPNGVEDIYSSNYQDQILTERHRPDRRYIGNGTVLLCNIKSESGFYRNFSI